MHESDAYDRCVTMGQEFQPFLVRDQISFLPDELTPDTGRFDGLAYHLIDH